MSFSVALLISALSGFIALSYEIIWYRAYSFVSQSSPAAFGLLLGSYLLGLALGSLGSRWFCRRHDAADDVASLRPLAVFVYLANAVSLLVVPGLGLYAATAFAWRGALALVALAAGLLGATLPLVAHFGIKPDAQAGARLSYVYIANIIGSVTGSLLTGFLFFDWWSMGGTSGVLAATGVGLSLLVFLASRPARPAAAAASAFALASLAAAAWLAPRLHDKIYEKLLWGADWKKHPPLAEIVENRHGVITVEADGTVWGGGAYDGRFNTNLINDRNSIIRAFGVGGMHPAPKNILMIGLSTGSWAQVIANMPGVERLTAIEINPGYLDLIGRHDEVKSLLQNPKFTPVIDDGRRWLRRNSDKKFDVIVMNTTFHYRAHATNLLSADFLKIARNNLAPGGILFYNTTSSRDVIKTGISVFPHALRFQNFLAVSDAPFAVDRARWEPLLRAWKIDGKPVFDLSQESHQRRLEQVLDFADSIGRPPVYEGLESRDSLVASHAGDHIITDDNMRSEWWSPHAP